ncbi:hypothetical protein M3Y98_00613500 [Aphelenchoides besseyi]|nr:hypothetical protein M3Y98_00613500 [Aphelenchoides besseyi]KAI6208306.1 hypothetical protein M3Y96_00101300 [Aphelenchoides besseyi]
MDAFNLLWPRAQGTTTNSNNSGSLPITTNSNLQQNSTLLPPFFGQVHISPTVKVVDGNLGLPTADPYLDPFDPRMLCNGVTSSAIADLVHRLNAHHDASNLATTTQLLEARGYAADTQTDISSTTAASTTAISFNPLIAACNLSSSASSVTSDASRDIAPNSTALTACHSNSLQASTTSLGSIGFNESTWTSQPVTADSFLTATISTLLSRDENVESSSTGDINGKDGDSKNGLICCVCGDRASGLHYGVQSCEGCKGFFRRSIQQKITYRPCTKSQNCAIVRNNRNRCQFCRLRKCLECGMSRDAVRFGRVPKREKVKMAEEMKRATVRSRLDAMAVELEDETTTLTAIQNAFNELGDKLRHELTSIHRNTFDESAGNLMINSTALLPLIVAVAEFAKGVRGFSLLYQNDRHLLLKSSFFQILLVRYSCLKSVNCSLIEPSAIPHHLLLDLPRDTPESTLLRNSVIEFVSRFRILALDETQLSLFSALVLCQSDASTTQPFEEPSLLKVLQEKLWWLLQNALFPNSQAIHTVHGPLLVQSLFAALTDLKTLDSLYREQLQKLRCQTSNVFGSILSMDTIGELSKTIRSIEQPQILPSKPAAENVRERHLALAQLLERPSLVLQHQSEVTVEQKVKTIKDDQQSIEEEDDEQPLNLCLRDARANTMD